jgi:hypothetical protein
VRLQLGQEWVLGERIGGGGFGQVYAAKSDDCEAVAKLVPKDPGAERELLFVDLMDAPNVVPVIDSAMVSSSPTLAIASKMASAPDGRAWAGSAPVSPARPWRSRSSSSRAARRAVPFGVLAQPAEDASPVGVQVLAVLHGAERGDHLVAGRPGRRRCGGLVGGHGLTPPRLRCGAPKPRRATQDCRPRQLPARTSPRCRTSDR